MYRTCNGKEIKPDGKNIKVVSQPDGSHVLVIEKVGPEHAGEYTVTATNDQGSVSSSAPLEVQGKTREGEPEAEPSFVREPRDTTADEGGPLCLSATFMGNPIPDVTWLKDGQPLEPSERVKITCDGKKVGLEINPCNLADVGAYTCRLTNPLGTAEAAAQGNVRKVFTPASFLQKFTDMQQYRNTFRFNKSWVFSSLLVVLSSLDT
ncbi:hypothetical protein FOCC_FOCC000008 [Frankliniella occidentalis]|nr:hypothetical protein FOCC_FOCC000008 [Frankliniella occidentalis]